MSKMQEFMGWVDARFPMTKMWEEHLSKYYAPKNFNGTADVGDAVAHWHLSDHEL